MLNASADLLSHLGLNYYSDLIKGGINKTLNEDGIFTADLGGSCLPSLTDTLKLNMSILFPRTSNIY